MTTIQVHNLVASSYELVAQEYYDSDRHPTCANFREASNLLLRKCHDIICVSHAICEVGPGRSLIAEYLSTITDSLDGLVLVDESPTMLGYSEEWGKAGAILNRGSAYSLPVRSNAFDLVVSCLGDPYNTSAFWAEVQRVLAHGGKVLFTTPSFEWAQSFRIGPDSCDLESADFELSDGRHVLLPSFIRPTADQALMIQAAGLILEQVDHICVRDLSSHKLSPKLLLNRETNANVVTGYVATKP